MTERTDAERDEPKSKGHGFAKLGDLLAQGLPDPVRVGDRVHRGGLT
jgi:hypothetical protein